MYSRYLRQHDQTIFPSKPQSRDSSLSQTLKEQILEKSNRKLAETLQEKCDDLQILSNSKRPNYGIDNNFQLDKKETRDVVWSSLVQELRKESKDIDKRMGEVTKSLTKRETLMQTLGEIQSEQKFRETNTQNFQPQKKSVFFEGESLEQKGWKHTVDERKFEERKNRFDNFLRNDFPEEVKDFVGRVIEDSAAKVQKAVASTHKELNRELRELRQFNTTLVKSKGRMEDRLHELRQEYKQMRENHYEQQYRVYEAFNATSKGQNPYTQFDIKPEVPKVNRTLDWDLQDLPRHRQRQVGDILDEMERLWS